MRMRHIRCIALCFFTLALAACGGKSAPLPGAYSGPPAMDVLTLPQNLTAYSAAAGGSKALVSMQSQIAAAERQKDAFFRPWRLDKPGRWIKQSLDKNFNMRPEKAYTDGKKPFPADAWEAMVANSNKSAWGKGAGPGITLRHSNLRAMPTSMHYYLRPDLPGEGYPFDYFQHTSVSPGTPVYICSVSKDGLWLLVDGPATAGWLPARDVARVDAAFITRWQAQPLAALTRDKVAMGEGYAHLGTLLPLGENGGLYYPQSGPSGHADIREVALASDAFTPIPLPLSADNVARVGAGLMGQAYGWGGLDEKRDCSALTRDLLAPFGLYLPRNSSNQAKRGRVFSLSGLSNQAKHALIVQNAAPFRSLVWMKGHIGLYLGEYEGKAVMLHSMWGLRTKDRAGGCDNRAVVGKTVITTLQPGIERPDLCNPGSFLDRIEAVALLFE